MKKLLSIILVMALVFSMTACDEKTNDVEDNNASNVVDNSDSENSETDSSENTEDSSNQNNDNSTGDETQKIDNSDLSADELFKQASEYYRQLRNFSIEQKINTCIINYSDLTAEPVLYPTLTKVSSVVYNKPFSFISTINYNYFDGGNNDSLEGIVDNDIVIEQYGELLDSREIKIYEKFSGVWKNLVVSQEEFVKNDNIGSKYIMNYGYYFRNGKLLENEASVNNQIIIAEYDLTDEFAVQLFMSYGFQNFVKSNSAEEVKSEMLTAMKDSKLTVYFDKNSHRILSMKIENPNIVSHLRQIVAVNHIEELSEETYLQLLGSFEKLKIYSDIVFGEENVDKAFEIPKEALK